MSPESFKELIEQYITGSLSRENRAAFDALLKRPEYLALLQAELESTFMDDSFESVEPQERKDRINQLIFEKINAGAAQAGAVTHRVHFLKRSWVRFSAAAMLIVALGSAFLFTWLPSPVTKDLAGKKVQPSKEIVPGHSGAILTLADGSKIVIDSLQQQKNIRQGSTVVMLTANQLAYEAPTAGEAVVTFNMLTVPRGRQFNLVLPDGTKVWLNAASSLRYPTAFSGSERLVEVSGEAYFEVAHDINKPFIVRKGSTDIKVLGTHFNVNAYDDTDSQDITLLEGSVSVTSGNNEVTISPGQQAQVSNKIKLVNNIDVEEVVAWKDGKFQFGETADIKAVMHQIANWYDVDVAYDGTVTRHIGGTISRNVSLPQLLKILQTTGVVKFQVEGRKITVLPQ